MDETKTGSKDSLLSSLTESWNIVESNDVNDTVEGSSDGESIEVIDEDANNLEEKKNKKEDTNIEEINSSESNNDVDDDDDDEEDSEISVTPSQIADNKTFLPDINENSFRNLINRTYNDLNLHKVLYMMALVGIMFISIGCAMITLSALMNAHNIAIDIIDYFSLGNGRRFEKSQQYLDPEMYIVADSLDVRLSNCEMNVIELRASITDLSGEVQKLKKKLASALRFPENEEYAQKMKKFELSTEEIKLFKKLFGVHMSKYPPINMPEDEINFNDSVKMLLGMVCNYTSGLEHESSMRDVHFFNQIPQLLDLLTKINSTNSNVDIFINAWKNKLEDMNLRILVDHKEIQLRMLRQLMKHIRLTYTKFHTKLCLLIGFKDVEMCNEFKKSLEMISMHQSKANHPNSGESPTSEDTGKKQPTGKPPNIKINKQAKQIRKNVKDDVIPDEEERCIEDRDVHHKQRIKLKNMKKNNPDKKCSEGPDNEQINSFNPKHMEEELGMSNDLKSGSRNNDQINSFSSFSNAKEVETETGCPEKTKEEGWERQKEMLTGQQSSDAAEGSWFLDIGNQRSKLRTSESLSDWLFERARYRSTHKP